jgi:hypothetical protein
VRARLGHGVVGVGTGEQPGGGHEVDRRGSPVVAGAVEALVVTGVKCDQRTLVEHLGGDLASAVQPA